MTSGHQDNAGVIAPPPLIFAVPLAAGLYFNRSNPFPIMAQPFATATGAALLGLAIILGVAALVQFWYAHTALLPHKPTTALIDRGPFRFSRNPVYLSLALGYVGIALLANTVWPLLLLPLALLMLHRGVIEREERYLEQKFGDEYIEYRTRVRRWL